MAGSKVEDQRGSRRAGRSRRRRALIVSAALLPGVGVLSGVAFAAFSTGPAGPSSALQAVNVSLGGDGTIAGMSATTLTKTGSKVTSTTAAYDPTRAAGDLPVKVSVAYLTGGHAGTDLHKLQGAAGRVEVDVTVTNTTLHPAPFAYSYANGPGTTYAEVATPLTVVATATLPAGSVEDVTQPLTGLDTDHTTNGLVSTTSGGATQVHWAAVLAPPRLAPTTTFRLVLDTTKFALSGLDISVQPGLQSDTSISQLLTTAFSGTSSSRTQDAQTVQLVRSISDRLIGTSRTLNQIQNLLVTNATTLGSSATGALKDTGETIKEDSQSLQDSLSSLQDQVSNSISGASTSSQKSLTETVQQLVSYLGLPAGGALPTSAPTGSPITARGCTAGANTLTVRAGTSLLDQLGAVSAALSQVAADGSSCAGTAQAALDASIGDSSQCPAALPPAGSPVSLACQLMFTSASLNAASTTVAGQSATIMNELDTTGQAQVSNNIASFITSLQALTGGLADIQTLAASNAAAAGNEATDLSPALTAAISDANVLGAGLSSAATTLTTAGNDLDPSSSSAVAQDATALANAICQLPILQYGADREAAIAYALQLRGLVTTAPCPSASTTGTPTPTITATPTTTPTTTSSTSTSPTTTDTPTPSPSDNGLSNRGGVSSTGTTLTGALSGTATTLKGAGSQAAGMAGDVTDLTKQLAAVGSVLTQIGSGATPPTGSSQALSAQLVTQLGSAVATLTGFYNPALPTPTQTDAAGCLVAPAGAPVLNALKIQAQQLVCNESTVATSLAGTINNAAAPIASASAALQQDATSAGAARSAADAQVVQLLNGLTGELSSAAKDEYVTGAGRLQSQSNGLTKSLGTSNDSLDSTASAAISKLTSETNAAAGSQNKASSLLQTQIAEVLSDLGSGTGNSGLLGAVSNSAASTGQGTSEIQLAAGSASEFGQVRDAQLSSALLGDEVNDASLALVQTFPVLGPALPAGTAHTSVFLFHLAG